MEYLDVKFVTTHGDEGIVLWTVRRPWYEHLLRVFLFWKRRRAKDATADTA